MQDDIKFNEQRVATHKRCTTCDELKSISEFYTEKRRASKSGAIYNRVSWLDVPDTHRPLAICKTCNDLRGRYTSYKYNAKKRGYAFNISKVEFSRLLNDNCYYCSAPPGEAMLGVNGIDRVFNDKGYEPSNVVTACGTCNYAKNKLTAKEWEVYLGRLVAHQSKHPFKVS